MLRSLVVAAISLAVLAPAAAAQDLGAAVGEGVREQSCRLLAGGTVNVPDEVAMDATGGTPASWAAAPAGAQLPTRVDLRSQTRSFNRLFEFALDGGDLYAHRRGSAEPWRQVPLPPCIAGRLASISADDDELVALDVARRIYTMDNALKDPLLWNWSSRWGTPTWFGPGYALPRGVRAWSWSVISKVEDGSWLDPAGNRTTIGDFKVSHIWGLRTGGRRLTFWDPWLPLDESYEMCGPLRGRFESMSLSASGSEIFVVGRHGDMFTRLYDFDISGHDPIFFKYAYESQRGKGNSAPIQLPAEPWRRQPKIRGVITSAISVHKVGFGSIHRVLRVEGRRGATTGYWERDIASPPTAGWSFHATGLPLTGRRLDNPRRDTSRVGLGRAEDARYVMERDGIRAELTNYNPYCSPARLVVTKGQTTTTYRLHAVDGLRQQVRGRGLDDMPRAQAGAIEGPAGHFETATVEATRSSVLLKERGWRLTRVSPSSQRP